MSIKYPKGSDFAAYLVFRSQRCEMSMRAKCAKTNPRSRSLNSSPRCCVAPFSYQRYHSPNGIYFSLQVVGTSVGLSPHARPFAPPTRTHPRTARDCERPRPPHNPEPWMADTRQQQTLYDAHDAAHLRSGILASRGPGPRLRCRPGLRRHGRAFILDADGRARGTGRILLARRVDRGCEVASRNCVACESCSA